MDVISRKDDNNLSLFAAAEGSPSRWTAKDYTAGPDGARLWGFAAAERDNVCGASELSTLAMSSPGVAQLSTPSEGDDSGGLVASMGSGTGASDTATLLAPGQQPLWRVQGGAAASSAPPSPQKSSSSKAGKEAPQHADRGQQIWKAVGGEDVINGSSGKNTDPRTLAVLKNLKTLLSTSDFYSLRHSGDRQAASSDRITPAGGSPMRLRPNASSSGAGVSPSLAVYSPSKAPNFAEAAVEALAAAKRAEASRLVVERLSEERLAAEKILVERLQMEDVAADRLSSEQVEGERMSAERMSAILESELLMNERLQRCEAREAFCEQQVVAEQGRSVLLRKELEAARRELEARDRDAKTTEELKAKEVHIAAKKKCLESMNEDAKREIETLRLQHHATEIDLGRSRSELATMQERQKVLEEELRLLKERPPKAQKPGAQKRAAGGKLLDRAELASRTAYSAQAVTYDTHEAKVLPMGKANSESDKGSWFFWGCCSATKASPSSAVNANAPEPAGRPQA